jgi:hypothetical protein
MNECPLAILLRSKSCGDTYDSTGGNLKIIVDCLEKRDACWIVGAILSYIQDVFWLSNVVDVDVSCNEVARLRICRCAAKDNHHA